MMDWKRAAPLLAVMLGTASLAGCSTFGDDTPQINTISAPAVQQVQPVETSSVASTSLPPLPGQNGSVANAGDANSGVVTGATPNAAPADTGTSQPMPVAPGASQVASTGSEPFVTLNDVGNVPTTPGRNLSGGLTVEKLIGGWTVTSGQIQCRLNLTYTAVGASDRYRASSPGCQLDGLSPVASWKLAGTQVQLFNGRNQLIGTLLLSGTSFIGTLSGGRGISMAG